jgi:hypothetical protein
LICVAAVESCNHQSVSEDHEEEGFLYLTDLAPWNAMLRRELEVREAPAALATEPALAAMLRKDMRRGRRWDELKEIS